MNSILTQQGAIVILDNVKSISLYNEEGSDVFNVVADQFIIGTYDSKIKGLQAIQWIANVLAKDGNTIIMPSNTAFDDESTEENIEENNDNK